jgi:hypothetical protein
VQAWKSWHGRKVILRLHLANRAEGRAPARSGFLLLSPGFMDSYPMSRIAVLPMAPKNGSPVPGLTSLYHKAIRGPYGDPRYPGNCSGELIKDLLRYFAPKRVLDPMTGSGTCADVCRELGIDCVSFDIREGKDACEWITYNDLEKFDFAWMHPPYWRQKKYTDHCRDLSNCPTLENFLLGYQRLLWRMYENLQPGGRLAVLMGDYSDREAGFVPLTYHTKRLAFAAGFRPCCTDIIRFSHGASSSRKTYRSSFIPGLHDVCMVFEKPHSRPPTIAASAA